MEKYDDDYYDKIEELSDKNILTEEERDWLIENTHDRLFLQRDLWVNKEAYEISVLRATEFSTGETYDYTILCTKVEREE